MMLQTRELYHVYNRRRAILWQNVLPMARAPAHLKMRPSDIFCPWRVTMPLKSLNVYIMKPFRAEILEANSTRSN